MLKRAGAPLAPALLSRRLSNRWLVGFDGAFGSLARSTFRGRKNDVPLDSFRMSSPEEIVEPQFPISISLSCQRPLKIGRCQDQKFWLKRKPVRESASSKPVAISSNKQAKKQRKKIYVIFSSLSLLSLGTCAIYEAPLFRDRRP